MIRVKNLAGGYQHTSVIHELDLEINRGEFFALLGPNGSGKTTLFKLITGGLPIKNGEVWIDGKQLQSFSPLEKARKIAVLTQEVHISFDFTVEEIISLGRYAFQKGIIKSLSKADKEIIEEVMELTDVAKFRNKHFRMISGGEKQRVLLAKALAQEPEIFLLDEPTNNLDIKHSFHMLDLLKKWQEQKGLTIFAILHDLNIASLYADRVALLHEGKFLEVGDVDTLRKRDQLKKVYEVQVDLQTHPTVPKPQLLMTPNHDSAEARIDFFQSYQLTQDDECIDIHFSQPLRTISNGVTGDGIQWLRHFCNFHVDKNYNCDEPRKDIETWMRHRGIRPEHSLGMMTAVRLEDMVLSEKEVEGIKLIVAVTAGVGNAVDISHEDIYEQESKIGTINSMVFVDANLTDGALVNAFMSATEAKTKALNDLKVKDPNTGTIATSTSTDSLLIGASQQGERTPYAGSGTFIGKGIGWVVYEATKLAIENYRKRKPLI